MSQAHTVALPQAWPIAQNLDIRSPTTILTKDAKIINGYVEKDPLDGKLWVYKRPGMTITTTIPASNPINTQGCFLSPNGNLIYIHGGVAYFGGSSFTVDPTDPYSFVAGPQVFTAGYAQYNYNLGLHNSAVGYTASYNNTHIPPYILMTQITDANFTSIATGYGFTPGFVSLDGTYYVMDIVGRIWGSNINDMTTWPVLNVISANTTSDLGVGIAKQLNYIVAFKQWGSQVFYDAGNTTGSPLAPVQDAQIPYGCAHGRSIQNIDDQLIWMATNRNIAPQVVLMKGLATRVVSTPAVERILDGVPPNVNPADTSIFSWSFKHGGHKFYGLSVVSLGFTLVFDLSTEVWQIWTGASGGVWPIFQFAGDSQVAQYFTPAAPSHTPPYPGSTSYIVSVDGDYIYPNDNGTLFPVDIYTRAEDFGTPRSKQLSAMYFLADQVNGSTLQSRYSDDDYQTWSNFESIDLSSSKPRLGSQGTFDYRRAYHFRHQANTTFRIKPGYLQMDIGTI